MLMSCCCTKIYKFCNKIDSCSDEFGKLFADLASGNYTIELDFLNSTVQIPITVTSGVVDISPLDQNKLNESYTYIGKVVDSSGVTVSLAKDAISYDCFQFETKLKF